MKNMVHDIGTWRAERAAAREAIRQALALASIIAPVGAPAASIVAARRCACGQHAAHTLVHTLHGMATMRVAEAAERLIDVVEHQQHLRASFERGAAACERAYCLACGQQRRTHPGLVHLVHTLHGMATVRVAEAAERLIDVVEHQQHLRASFERGAAACERAYCLAIDAVETLRDLAAVWQPTAVVVRSLMGSDVGAACTALEAARDAELERMDDECTAKARRLQQDRAAMEAHVAEWVGVAERMAALLADSHTAGPPSADHAAAQMQPMQPHPCTLGLLGEDHTFTRTWQHACAFAEVMAALDRPWPLLQCGHAGAPLARIRSDLEED